MPNRQYPCALRNARRLRALTLLLIVGAGGCRHGAIGAFDTAYEQLAARATARGNELAAAEDHAGAAEAYDTALGYWPGCATAHMGAGRAAEALGDADKAIEHYGEAVKNAPSESVYAVALGDALRRKAVTSIDRDALVDAALRAYRHALSIDAGSRRAAQGIGLCHRINGRTDQAIEAFRHAARMDDGSAEPHFLLAGLYESLSRYPESMRAYRVALKLAPEDARIHNACAAMNARLADVGGPSRRLARQRAIAHYRRSLEIEPDQPKVVAEMEKLGGSGPRWLAGGIEDGE